MRYRVKKKCYNGGKSAHAPAEREVRSRVCSGFEWVPCSPFSLPALFARYGSDSRMCESPAEAGDRDDRMRMHHVGVKYCQNSVTSARCNRYHGTVRGRATYFDPPVKITRRDNHVHDIVLCDIWKSVGRPPVWTNFQDLIVPFGKIKSDVRCSKLRTFNIFDWTKSNYTYNFVKFASELVSVRPRGIVSSVKMKMDYRRSARNWIIGSSLGPISKFHASRGKKTVETTWLDCIKLFRANRISIN